MRYNRPDPVDSIKWKTHAKRFLKGFPIEIIELYAGMVVLFGIVGVVVINQVQGDVSVAAVQRISISFRVMAWTFALLPFVRGMLYVIGIPLAERYNLQVNANE